MELRAVRLATFGAAAALFAAADVGEAGQVDARAPVNDLVSFLAPQQTSLQIRLAIGQAGWIRIGAVSASGCKLTLAPQDAGSRPISVSLADPLVARVPTLATVVFLDSADTIGGQTLMRLRKDTTPADTAFHTKLRDKLNAALASCGK